MMVLQQQWKKQQHQHQCQKQQQPQQSPVFFPDDMFSL
jgi:hypothetical protein